MSTTILVVDDSDVVLSVVKTVLETAGYRVVTQNKASGSLAHIIQEKPALVLLDVQMPSLAGDVLARMCAKTAQDRGTRVALHSSLSDDVLSGLVGTCGACGYIRKTDNPQALVRQVKKLLKDSPLAAPEPTLERTSSGRMRKAKVADRAWILLVDRDMETLSVMRDVVRSIGLHSEFALSTRQAVDRLRAASPPQAIVVSSEMPDSGLDEVLQVALGVNPTWSERFVVTSLGTPLRTPPRFAGKVVRKPIEQEELADAILSALAG